jgi:hypothetical protein
MAAGSRDIALETADTADRRSNRVSDARWIAGVAAGLLLALPAAAGDLPIRPDPKLTPGAILTTDAVTVRQ